ncbi:hypothetical protein Dimus_014688 [Dionaea muscipula]
MTEMSSNSNNRDVKKVLVAIEESEISHYALEWALENLHHKISSSGLVLFHVISNDYSQVYASNYGNTPPELISSIQENQKNFANALLQKAKEISEKHGITAETVIEFGSPKEAICDAVEQLSIQLIVIGSHSRGVIQRAFLGSVSNYVVHNAKCPVLVVRKQA